MAPGSDSDEDSKPNEAGETYYPPASNVEEAKAAGLRVALNVLESYARDGSDPPTCALPASGMIPPSEDALRQVVQVTYGSTSS